MIFNQFQFLFIFLPAVLITFNAPRCEAARPYVLIAASMIFYGFSGIEHALVLASGILWVGCVSIPTAAVGSRAHLVVAVVPPLLALFYYKYLGFFIREVIGIDAGSSSETFDLFANILLPAGISFFTFQLVSFAVDRYRGDIEKAPNLRDFALYISFFPQLVAGPILRFRQVADALAGLQTFRLPIAGTSKAIAYVCLGLAAKVLIADTLNNYQAPLVAEPGAISSLGGLYIVFAYSFQIYFDFYGYSLIAIGLGIFFGFDFPKNFDRPYAALNPREFWRRWHMTLSYWIRDYLYMPLGGNRSYVCNILIVFTVCGLWHGAGWTFIVWGLYHGALVVAYRFTAPVWDQASRLLQRAATFTLISFGWILFLFDFQGIGNFAYSLAGLSPATVANPSLEMWIGLLIATFICFGVDFEAIAEDLSESRARSVFRSTVFAFLFVATLMFLDRSQTFIYFRF